MFNWSFVERSVDGISLRLILPSNSTLILHIQSETEWMWRLNTVFPTGLNSVDVN